MSAGKPGLRQLLRRDAEQEVRRWTRWGPGEERKRTSEQYWRQPIRWDRRAAETGIIEKVFCASLADVFDNRAPAGAREDLWELIRQTPNLDWQLLTKRPQNLSRFLPGDWSAGNYPHVWLGVSAEDQTEYDRRWPILASVQASVRFVSYEPALEPLSLAGHESKPGWLIWGGESGPGARPVDPDWIRGITQECAELGIPAFGKQWGRYENNPLTVERRLSHSKARELDPEENGKGGSILDGKLWREFPRRQP